MASTPHTLSLSDLSPAVATWLSTVVDAMTTRDRHGVQAPIDGRADAGDLIMAARGLQAWAEAAEIEGARRLLDHIETDPTIGLGAGEPGSSLRTRASEARRAVSTELQVLTGLPITQCRERVALASAASERGAYLRERMRCGILSAWRATTLLRETRHLDPLTASAVGQQVLRPVHSTSRVSDSGSPEGAELPDADPWAIPLSQSTFRRRLARHLTQAEAVGKGAARGAKQARDARDATVSVSAHGMAAQCITASRGRAFAAQRRMERLARAARAAGDSRTLTQLRSDIATDLLLFGTVPGDALLGQAPPGRVEVIVKVAALLPLAGPTTPAPSPTHISDREDAGDRSTLRGGSPDSVGEVPGCGFLTAAQVREIAFAAGSTWRRLVTDPVSGAVMDASRHYRPTKAMRTLVAARDGTCRAPGCDLPATDADLDHDRRWREDHGGPTHPDNLHALHRGHHHAKTRGWWQSRQTPDGAVHWRTLTGRHITTRPADRHASGDEPPRVGTALERDLARLAERQLDPIPPETPELAALAGRLLESRRVDRESAATPPTAAAVTHHDFAPAIRPRTAPLHDLPPPF